MTDFEARCQFCDIDRDAADRQLVQIAAISTRFMVEVAGTRFAPVQR
jgi:hypothetical protein